MMDIILFNIWMSLFGNDEVQQGIEDNTMLYLYLMLLILWILILQTYPTL